MTQPLSFTPARTPGDQRVGTVQTAVPASTSDARVAPAQVPLSKLTDLARQLAAAGPPFDHAKIAEVRRAIAEGTFRIDAGAIADALMRHTPQDDA